MRDEDHELWLVNDFKKKKKFFQNYFRTISCIKTNVSILMTIDLNMGAPMAHLYRLTDTGFYWRVACLSTMISLAHKSNKRIFDY